LGVRFDHAVIAVRDLDAAATSYRAAGFIVEPGGRHTGKGTANALIRFDADYLELLAVDDRAEALASGPSRATLVAFLDANAAGMTTFALATSDLDGARAALERLGVDSPAAAPTERRRPDGSVLRWRALTPGGSSMREAWPFLIDWPDGQMAAGLPAVAQPNGTLGVVATTVVTADERALAIYDALGVPLSPDAHGGWSGHAGTAVIRVVPGEAADAGPSRLTLRVADLAALRRSLEAGGVRLVAGAAADHGAYLIGDAPPELAMLAFVGPGDAESAR